MKDLRPFALPIVGLAVCITLAQSGQKPRNVDEVYALLEDRLNSLELRLQDTEQSLNAERIRSRTLKVKVRRLERERNRYKGSEIPVGQGASQANKAVRVMKSRLQNLSTRVDAIELDSQRLMVRANETGKMIDIIRRRSDDISTKLGAISLKAELSLTNSYETNQTVQELKAVIGNHSARIDVTERKCDSLMKGTNHTDQTGTRNTTALVQTRNTTALVQTRNTTALVQTRNTTALVQTKNTTAREDHTEQGTMADYLRIATDVEGAPTSRHGVWSIATCPDNTTMVGCRCSHEGSTCEAVTFSGQKCAAHKSDNGSNPIQAHAKCVHGGPFVVIEDPEKGKGLSSQPLARCPSHTRVAACWLYNKHADRKYVETRLDRGGNSCTVSEPCLDAGCWIKALCREN